MKFAKFLGTPYRSSHRICSVWKSVLRNLVKFTGKHLCQSLILNKVAALRPAVLLKRQTLAQLFSCEFYKFLRTPILQNCSRRLILTLVSTGSPVADSDSFRFPACNFIKKEILAKMFFSEFCKLFVRPSFDRTPPHDCFISFYVNFEKFFRTPLL